MRTCPRYSEDVPGHQNEVSRSRLSKVRAGTGQAESDAAERMTCRIRES